MTQNFENFREKFRMDELTLKTFDYWVWSLRPDQITLPSTVLSLKRPAEHMSDMTPEETEELSTVINHIESSLKAVCHYDKINYLCFMMVDHHIHIHVIPRYENEVDVQGFTVIDKQFPKPPQMTDITTVTEDQIRVFKELLGEA